jgi:hypothetical protein
MSIDYIEEEKMDLFNQLMVGLMGTLLGAFGMRWLDSRGAVRIYRKLVYQKATGKPMGDLF